MLIDAIQFLRVLLILGLKSLRVQVLKCTRLIYCATFKYITSAYNSILSFSPLFPVLCTIEIIHSTFLSCTVYCFYFFFDQLLKKLGNKKNSFIFIHMLLFPVLFPFLFSLDPKYPFCIMFFYLKNILPFLQCRSADDRFFLLCLKISLFYLYF